MKKVLVLVMCLGGALLSAQQNVPAQVFDVQGQPRAVRVRVDALESAARGRRAIRVPLTTGEIVVRLSEFVGQADGFFAKGAVVDAPAGQRIDGEATFTVFNDVVVGRIVHGNRVFMMRRIGATGVHELAEVDLRALPPELDPRTASAEESGEMARPADPATGNDSNQFVDLLVVYTPAARTAIGGTANMQAEVVGAVNNANAALAAANVTHRFRLVHQTEVTYTEVGFEDLDHLTAVGDGILDEVHQLRDVYRADIVSFVGTSNACGVGWLLQSNTLATQRLGFNVNHWSCINASLTLAHEIGHNMGLHHDRKNAMNSDGQLEQGSSEYAYGYRIPGARDVMAYPCNLPLAAPEPFSCNVRRTIYSTPLANFSGTESPAGVANSEDNARALNDTSPTVANFRDATCSYALSAGRTTFGASGGATTMTVTTGAGCAWTAVSGDTDMLTLSGTRTRVGGGTFIVTLSPLSGTAPRSGVVYAGGESFAFHQVGTCDPAILFSATSFPRTGGSGTATVTFPEGCGAPAWTASSSESFLAITAGASGTGNGTVAFSVAASSVSMPRTAVMTIAGLATTITQAGTTMTASPASLQFGAAKAGADGELVAATEPQRVILAFDGGGSPEWTAVPNQSWLQVTNGTGVRNGIFTVGIVNPGNVIAGATSLTGSITVTASMTGNSPITIPVTLSVRHTTTEVPFGVFDTPLEASTVAGSIAVTGWALDDVGIDRVEIWRDLIPNDPAPPFRQNGHPADGKVFIANGTFVEGTRPDVEGIYTSYPARHRAGWGYLLLTQGFPNANGTFVLTALAWDEEGQSTVLGVKTIHVNNAASTKPFGSIDVPGYGTTFSGHQFTFGWALTPNADCTVSGGQVYMAIDSAPPLFPVTYGANRTDIAWAFPGFQDSNGAGGAVALNSLNYSNGTHQIGWLVYDSCGNGEGIGSRFFTIFNSGSALTSAGSLRSMESAATDGPRNLVTGTGPAFGRTTLAGVPTATDALWLVRGIGTVETPLPSSSKVWLSQTGRIEVHATRPGVAPMQGLRYEGYLVVDGTLRALPLGSSFDATRGSFFWQPVPGFLGTYEVRIVQLRGDTPEVMWSVPLEVGPESDRVLLQIDSTQGVLTGWSLDPLATDSAGIGHVHVWTGSAFVGTATLGHHRKDVGDRYGRQFDWSGFSLPLTSLPPGTHDLVVYAWSVRTGRWEAARTVRHVAR